jgi:simple sugar transport system ATP-binding protein
MNPPDSGEIIFEKQEVKWRSNREAISAGIGYVPEDRMNHGLIMDQPIIDNITITTLLSYVNKAGLLEDGKRLEMLNEMKEELKIRMSLPEAAVKTLSGGNQQKIVLAKWLKVNPKILILDEPTIGIDVIAKNSIHTLIKVLANLGMSIIMISSEIQEVQTNCHRILIMRDGKILCEFKPDELTEDELLEKYNLS